MTTTFSLMAHGRFGEAVLNQPMGVVLFLVTSVVFVLSLIELVRPRFVWKSLWRLTLRFELRLVVLVLLGLLGGWAYKIWEMASRY